MRAALLATIPAWILFSLTSAAAPYDCLSPMNPVALTVQSSLFPSLPGQAVTFTAFVEPVSGTQDPSGTVQLMDGTTDLGTFPLMLGQVSTTTVFYTAGAHSIYAAYSGDTNYCENFVRFGQQVNRFVTSLALTSSGPASTFGQPVTFTAQLGPPPPIGVSGPSGQVQFFDGSTAIGTVTLTAATAATVAFTTSNLTAGSHQITAMYSGDLTWFSVRSAALSQTVSRVPTVTALAVSNLISNSNQVTLVATVSPASSSGTPGGSVQFVDTTTNASLGTALIPAGMAAGSLSVNQSQLAAAAGHAIAAIYSGDVNFASSMSNSVGIPALINATGAISLNFAAEELVSLFGSNLANTTLQANIVPLPVSLGGYTVSVIDSAGVLRRAGLYLVSPEQLNFVVPAGTAPGAALVTLNNTSPAAGVVIPIQINIVSVAPGLFTASSDGKGLLAAQIIRVQADGTQITETVSATPINMGSNTLYLVLYGTGIRNRSSMANVTCTINGQSLPVAYAGPQSQYPGLDQIDVLLPPSLKGAGQVNVTLTADGQASNTGTLTFQ